MYLGPAKAHINTTSLVPLTYLYTYAILNTQKATIANRGRLPLRHIYFIRDQVVSFGEKWDFCLDSSVVGGSGLHGLMVSFQPNCIPFTQCQRRNRSLPDCGDGWEVDE